MAKDKPKKSDRKKKAGKKASQFAIRVETSERDDFVALCERLDTTAAREIRRFMRDFVARHRGGDGSMTAEDTAAVETPAAEPTAPEAAKAPPTRARKPRTPRAEPGTGTTKTPTPPARKPTVPRSKPETGSAEAPATRGRKPRAVPETDAAAPKTNARKPRKAAAASDAAPMAPPRRPRASKAGAAPATKRRSPGRPPKPAD